MFGGFAPPQLSEQEMRQLEGEANWTVKQFLAAAVVLYICMSSSTYHAPQYRAVLFPTGSKLLFKSLLTSVRLLAPFVVDAVSGIF
ncbi:hypothetical protein F4782DRAFT_446669 [Xylaria castorea]|nr:hypothetical protein F4782DRAFT_446669 [Xylaria castorea]